MSEYNKPVPLATPFSEPFFHAARRHQLVALRCLSCGAYRLAERATCPKCWSDGYEWVGVSGRGRVYSYVLMHQQLHPGFAEEIPYNVALIDLDEGPRLVSNIVDCPNEEVRVGMAVEVVFDDVTPDVTMVRFRPHRPR